MNTLNLTSTRFSAAVPLTQPLQTRHQAVQRNSAFQGSQATALTSGGLGNPFKAVGNWVKDVLKSIGAIFGLGTRQEKAAPAKEPASNSDPTHVCDAGCPIHGDEAHNHGHSAHGHEHHHHH